MLSGPSVVTTAADRVAGYRRALLEAGVPLDDSLILEGPYTLDSGYTLAEQILTRNLRPTALVAANNFIAIGALRALRAAGLRVPKDMSLVAFDDLPAPIVIDPFFTVVSQPAYEMGQTATALLLERLAGNGPAAPQDIVLPTQLIVRNSSAPPCDGD